MFIDVETDEAAQVEALQLLERHCCMILVLLRRLSVDPDVGRLDFEFEFQQLSFFA